MDHITHNDHLLQSATSIDIIYVAGFAEAMADALVGKDYWTYGYSCAGAIGYGAKDTWYKAFTDVSGSTCLWLSK